MPAGHSCFAHAAARRVPLVLLKAIYHAGSGAARTRECCQTRHIVSVPLRRIDGLSWLAMACIAVGWFGLDTLVATFGPVRHTAHFYDLPAVMLDPPRFLIGPAESLSAGRFVFGLLCVAVIALPVLPRLGVSPARWLLISAPLLWMALCGIVLYVKTATAHIAAPERMGRLGGYLASWANGAMDWSGDVVARHIALGPGAYLALIGATWLAYKGANELRASAAVTGPARAALKAGVNERPVE